MTTPSNFSILLLPTTALTLLHEPALDHGVDAFVWSATCVTRKSQKLTLARQEDCCAAGFRQALAATRTRSLCAMVLNSYSSSKTNIHAHKHRFTYMGKL
jgi:hypothetical protein